MTLIMATELNGNSNHPLNVGWIPYWNLRPLRTELKRLMGSHYQFVDAHPAQVNKLLAQQEVICAPASAAALLLHPRLEILAPLGVASNGPIQSVYLGLSGATIDICEMVRLRLALVRDVLNDALDLYGDSMPRVAKYFWQELENTPSSMQGNAPILKLSSASATGALLSKFFYRVVFGKQAFDTHVRKGLVLGGHHHDCTLELVIGDEALCRRSEFTKILDLGSLWKNATGLPFVFAIWLTGNLKAIPTGFISTLVDAAECAEAKMHIDCSSYLPAPIPLNHAGTEVDLASYWKCMSYRIGAPEVRGLTLFLCLARSLVVTEEDDAIGVRLLRWQQQVDRLSMR